MKDFNRTVLTVVKQQLEEKRSFLRNDPFRKEPFEAIELKGPLKGKFRIRLVCNYRYIFHVNIQSHKIYSDILAKKQMLFPGTLDKNSYVGKTREARA